MTEKAKRPSLTSLVGQMVVPGDNIMNLPTDGQACDKLEITSSQRVPASCDTINQSFEVDIGAAAKATLPMLNFEGASRRNRPNIKASIPCSLGHTVGQLVYARVETVHREVDPELSCVDNYGK
eukprot:gene15856-18805_t